MRQSTNLEEVFGLDLDVLEREAFSGRYDRALIAHRLVMLGDAAKDAFTRLRCCVILKEIGGAEDAYHVMRDALSAVRNHRDSVHEYALICRRLGRDEEADAELARLLRADQPSPATLCDLVFRCYFDLTTAPRRARAFRRSLRRLRRTQVASAPSEIDTFEEFAEFAAPLTPAILKLYRERRFVSPYDVVTAASDALIERRPFAFVRLGDGEGALLAPEPMAHLFTEHRAYFLERWFGAPALANDPDMLGVAAELRRRLPEIDVLGVPGRSWLLHERDHRQVRTFMCCMSAAMTAIEDRNGQKLCGTSMHIDIAYRDMFDDLIRMAAQVLVVTSHADLAPRLKAHLGLSGQMETLLIPPAHSDLCETGYTIERSHPADAFAPTLAALAARAKPGTLVLIGAGFLGKLYCLAARRAGAVAIDIGSVADLWMGFATRPNFVDLGSVALPDARRHKVEQVEAEITESVSVSFDC